MQRPAAAHVQTAEGGGHGHEAGADAQADAQAEGVHQEGQSLRGGGGEGGGALREGGALGAPYAVP